MTEFPPCRRRIVLVSPDIRYPAYVFRRGLESGLRLLTSDPPQKTETLALVVFYGNHDQVKLKRDGDGQSVIVTLNYGIPAIKKTPVIDPKSGIAVPLQTITPPTFHLALPEPKSGDQLVYFSEGRFRLWSQ